MFSKQHYETMTDQWAAIFVETGYNTFKSYGGVDKNKWKAFRDDLPQLLGRVIWKEIDTLSRDNPNFDTARFIESLMRKVAKRYEEKRVSTIVDDVL